MEKIVFATNYNGLSAKDKGEVHKKPSMTVPDKTISLRELLLRHVQGMPLPNMPQGVQPYYNEEVEIPDLRKLDLTEIDELRRNTTNEINYQKERLAKLNTEKRAIIEERKAAENSQLASQQPGV